MRYILAVLALLLTVPAQAQTPDSQVEPEIVVGTPGDIATEINNFTFEYPEPYTLPDTTQNIILGASLFTANNDEVTPIAPVYTEEGVSGDFVVAVTDDGDLSQACGDDTADNPTISNDVSGQIVMVARGTCSFVFKTQIVQEAGGIGIIIYNPEGYVSSAGIPDGIGNLIAPAGYTTELTIPTMILPYSMAEPIVTALLDGDDVSGTMRAAETPVAIEDTPEAAALAFGAAAPNPFSSVTTFKMSLPEPEVITVEVYDVQGRRVATLHDGLMTAGESDIRFVAGDLPSGVYMVRATGEQFSLTRTVSVIR